MKSWTSTAAAIAVMEIASSSSAQPGPDGSALSLDGRIRYVALDCPGLRPTAYAVTIYAKKDPPRPASEVVRWRLP